MVEVTLSSDELRAIIKQRTEAFVRAITQSHHDLLQKNYRTTQLKFLYDAIFPPLEQLISYVQYEDAGNDPDAYRRTLGDWGKY